jgi:O-antigen/teichoic acid export membrane protein
MNINSPRPFFKRLLRSEYFRNTAILTSGTTFSQLITIITAPFMTRIYHPADYDVLGLYMMVTGLVGTLVTLQYHNVVITARDDKDAKIALSICIATSAAFAFILCLFSLILYNWVPLFLRNNQINLWLLWSPVSVFFGGWNIAFAAWAVRKQRFKLLSMNRIISAIMVPAFSIVLGLLIAGPLGLMVGLLLSQVIPSVLLSNFFFRKEKLKLGFKISTLKKIGWQHRSYVKYSMPAEFINNFINQLPIIFLARNYPVAGLVGNFNLSNRMLGMPVQLISSSVLEVFRQKASSEYNAKGNCFGTFVKTSKALFFMSIIPFAILIFAGPWIFKTVFGSNWETAGFFSRIMAPLFFFRFTVSPLTYVFYILGKQKLDLILHIVMFAGVILVFITNIFLKTTVETALFSYSLFYCFIYIIYFIFSWKFSRNYG